jgi:hypothetical protein
MPELTESQRQNAKRAWHDAAMAKQNLVKILDPDEIITTIAPHVQYAPTEPGAPLSDRECNKLNTSLYGGISAEAIAVINAVLANRNIRKEQPAPLDGHLIEKMCDAYNSDSGSSYSRSGMTAAARVIADVLLGPVADDEWISPDDGKTVQATRYGVNQILAKRRARIGAKTKTPEERVKIEEVATHATDGSCYWEKRLYCDGNEMKQIDVLNYAYQGLIEKLKKEEADRTRVESR